MLRTSSAWAFAAVLSATAGAASAAAQTTPATATPLPMASPVPVPAAKLYRVDDGVFEIEMGKPIDLTNRRILLWIGPHRDGCCDLTLNGQRFAPWQAGSRLNLKEIPWTRQHVADRAECYLDIIEVVVPKGGKSTATFRLHCI